jgi:uncharacterized membrane protein
MDEDAPRPAPEHEGETRPHDSAQLARGGNWFVLLVCGLIVLCAIIFYRYPGLSATSPGCHAQAYGFTCSGSVAPGGIFGSGLGSPVPLNGANVSPWATTYWVISIFVGILGVVGFYWPRSRALGTPSRAWPFVALGTGAVVLFVAGRGWLTSEAPANLLVRGMQALLVIALGLIVLAIIEKSWRFALFVAGFLGLALLSCLYNVSNLFERLDLGRSWTGNNEAPPNLILPGLYLVAGGLALLVIRRDARRRELDRAHGPLR